MRCVVLVAGELDPESERSVTPLLRLEFADVVSVVEALRSFVSGSGLALPYPPSQSIILAGTEAQLRRMMAIARVIDRASDEQLIARVLRHRSAKQAATMLEEIFNSGAMSIKQVEIWTDERTNMLLLRAGPDRLEEVRAFLADFDRPVEGKGVLRVIRIRNRDAEEIAEVLRSMAARRPTARRPEVASMLTEAQISHDLTGRDYALVVDQPTRSLLVRTDPETFELLVDVVSQLDRIPPRISLELLVFELTAPSSFTFGVDFLLPLVEPKSRDDFVVAVRSSPTGELRKEPDPDVKLFGRFARDPLLLTLESADGQTVTLPIDRESVTFEADERHIQTNVLLRPQIVVLSGEEHELFVGSNIPVPVAGGASQPAAGGGLTGTALVQSSVSVVQQIQRQDVGIRLRVKPTLGQAGVVRLDLDVEVSRLAPSIAGDVERVGPTIEKRDIVAAINLRDGEYAVIGMSTDRRERAARRGVPFLMDIPLLGYLFSRVEKSWVDTELIVVAQATVLRSMSDNVAETIRRRLAFERSLSRVDDLSSLSAAPYAVLIETLPDESKAQRIADAFGEDGFSTRVTSWKSHDRDLYDVYLTGFTGFAEAGGVARQLSDAGWPAEITVLPSENELAGE